MALTERERAVFNQIARQLLDEDPDFGRQKPPARRTYGVALAAAALGGGSGNWLSTSRGVAALVPALMLAVALLVLLLTGLRAVHGGASSRWGRRR